MRNEGRQYDRRSRGSLSWKPSTLLLDSESWRAGDLYVPFWGEITHSVSAVLGTTAFHLENAFGVKGNACLFFALDAGNAAGAHSEYPYSLASECQWKQWAFL